MNKTEEQYKKLLETADKIGYAYNEESETLTDEQVDAMIDALDQNNDPVQSLPSNNGVIYNENTDPDQNKTAKVLITSNPVTGLMNTIPYDSSDITEESIDTLIDMKDEDMKRIEIGWDQFVKSTKEMYPAATEDGLKQLFDAVQKYRANVKFPYFNELPQFIKDDINKYANIGAAEHGASNNTVKQLKNMLAKELYDTIIMNNYSSKTFKDISTFTQNEINKEMDKLESSTGEYNAMLRKEYEEGFLKRADQLEAENPDDEDALVKVGNLRKTSHMFTQAYTYEDMYNAYSKGKIKVKSIQIDKFKRTCQDFNQKYYNSTFKISDIGMTIGVLDRILDKKYDMKIMQKFIVVFINYTKNFKPSNVWEHVFMFYFIQNILALDIRVAGEYESFNQLVKENIYKFLDLIIEMDDQKSNNVSPKKGAKN